MKCSLASPKDATPPNFEEKIFVNSHNLYISSRQYKLVACQKMTGSDEPANEPSYRSFFVVWMSSFESQELPM